MNDNTQLTSAPGSTLIPDSTSVITTMHLVLIAIFAVAVIIAILWGMRLKRRRAEADREIAADNDRIVADRDSHDVEPTEVAPAPPPVRAQRQTSAPAPVSPAPPPMTDAPAIGTPPAATTLTDEPAAVAVPASPATEAAALSADTKTDETVSIPVTTLKGLGPKVAARLAELGVTDAGQLASLDDNAAAALDAQLGSFAGRMARDRWIEQARLLTAGDRASYEATFGKL